MNEAALKELRKHFKNADTSRIAVKEMIAVYLKPETEEPIYVKESYFERLDEDDKNHLMRNFKKILTGGVDKKVFELRFNEDDTLDSHTQDTLDTMLQMESLQDFAIESNPIINKLIDSYTYETDVVFHLIRFELDTEEQIIPFILGTVNKVEQPKGQYVLHYGDGDNKDFTTTYSTDPIINLTSPIDGFMYPSMDGDQANVNRIINFHKKANETNPTFISTVLNAEIVLTARQEKTYFNMILKKMLGDKVKPKVLHQIYSSIHRTFETEEETEHRVLHRGQLLRILEAQIDELAADIEDVFEDVIGVQNYGFKVDNITPDFSKKSLEIKSDEAEIRINPKDLNKVRQVRSEDGNMFLMVEILSDSSADGLSFDSDEIPTIIFED